MSEAPLRPFALSLPMALLKAREAVMSNFRPILAEGLTEQQWRVLRALADVDNTLSVNQLAERTLLLWAEPVADPDRFGGTRRADRSKAPEDARRAVIAINGGGPALLAKIGPRSETRYQWIEEQLGDGELARLYELLALVADAVVDPGRTGLATSGVPAAAFTRGPDEQSAWERDLSLALFPVRCDGESRPAAASRCPWSNDVRRRPLGDITLVELRLLPQRWRRTAVHVRQGGRHLACTLTVVRGRLRLRQDGRQLVLDDFATSVIDGARPFVLDVEETVGDRPADGAGSVCTPLRPPG